MAKLNEYLEEWLSANLLSEDQVKNIQHYEQSKPERHWFLYGILCVGVTVFAIGIISLIAANWANIPKAAKLVGNFIVLGVIAKVVFNLAKKENQKWFEVACVFFSCIILASIGLVAQIYHTGGALYQALFLWLVLLFPLMLSTQRQPLSHVWLLIFLSGVFSFWVENARHWFDVSEEIIGATLLYAAPALLVLVSKASALAMPEHAFAKVTKFWGLLLLWCLILVNDLMISNHWDLDFDLITQLCLWVIYGFVLVTIVFDKNLKPIYAKIAIAQTLIYLCSIYLITVNPSAVLLGAAISISFFGMLAFYFALTASRGLFNLCALYVTLRFLIIYFDALGGLAYTGFGLIFSGSLILGLGFTWHKNRARINLLLEGAKL